MGSKQGWAGAFDQSRTRLVDLPQVADDDRPLYARIAGALTEAIDARVFGQGMRLPPAASIAHHYATSVNTARAAVRLLIDAGVVTRKPGAGVYVTGRREPQDPR